MVVLNINHVDYTVLLKDISTKYNIPLTGNNLLTLPPSIGKGYLKTVQLHNGLQAMLIDLDFNYSFITIREQADNCAFVLHFDDLMVNGSANYLVDGETLKKTNTRVTLARLTSNMYLNSEEIPPLAQFKAIKILFDENWLKKYLGLSSNTTVLKTYLSLKTASFEIEQMDEAYLGLTNEIWTSNINDPLQDIYIENRINLLIERFFTRLHSNDKLLLSVNLTDDELERLVTIENILVGDFSIAPPTIDACCRIISMSKTKLKISFKKVYGLSMFVYYQKQRMKKAGELLVSGTHNINQTAKAVGYQNVSNFIVAYQKHFLILPVTVKQIDCLTEI